MNRLIDLHSHTNASDGSLSPSEFVLYCKEKNVTAAAVTDHDTAAAAGECIKYGKKYGVNIIPGIELSAKFSGELHILGLFIDYTNKNFQNCTSLLKEFRKERNIKMINKFGENGIKININTVLKFKNDADISTIGRVHMAKALIEKGYCTSVSDAFSKYLSHSSPFYCEREKFTAKKCIEIIHSAGGLSFLAHPCHSAKTARELETLIKILVSYGLDGIECYHSSMTPAHTKSALELCKKYSLLISAGSDFHGINKETANLGHTFGGCEIHEEILLNILKSAKAKNLFTEKLGHLPSIPKD